MKPQVIAGIGIAVAAFAAGLGASSVLNKTSAPPETSRIAFENEKVRVIEYRTNSGKNVCGLGMHSHPAHLYIMFTPAKTRVITPDGKEEIVEDKAGAVGWEPAGTHRAECISGENVVCYLVEVKDKDWKPSTGLTN